MQLLADLKRDKIRAAKTSSLDAKSQVEPNTIVPMRLIGCK